MANVSVTTLNEAGGQYDLRLFRKTYLNYIALSKFLFASKNPIYDINEMPEKCKFYEHARNIAEQLDIQWDSMTHEESNRIMLALLEDCYKEMATVSEKKNLAIQVLLKVTKDE